MLRQWYDDASIVHALMLRVAPPPTMAEPNGGQVGASPAPADFKLSSINCFRVSKKSINSYGAAA